MKTISNNLLAAIRTGKIASLVKITRKDLVSYGYTDHDIPLLVDGYTYNPSPALQHIRMVQTRDSEVSTQEFESAWFDVPSDDLLSGKFDDALIEIGLCAWENPSYGKITPFTGNLTLIKWTDEGFKAEVSTYIKKLQNTIGAVYTPTCRHELYSQPSSDKIGFCGLSKASFTFTGSISSIVTQKWKFGISVSQADDYFNYAVIKFTTGNNAGLSYEIKNHVSNQISLMIGTAFLVNTGDQFQIYTGCDKTLTTCKNKFNNVVNFGGMPHLRSDTNAIAI